MTIPVKLLTNEAYYITLVNSFTGIVIANALIRPCISAKQLQPGF